jgi:hypothetical protein
MALTVISAPEALPTSQQDYVDQNVLIATSFLDPEKIYKIDYTNSEVKQGSIINLGGTILKAVAAESITGTASDFVKIDHSAYTASYVSDLTGVSWNSTYNGYYDGSGDLYLFDEFKAYFSTGEISEVNYKSTIDILNGFYHGLNKTWIEISINFAIANVNRPSITALNSTDIAFLDSFNDELRTYRFDGRTWSQIGSGLSVSATDQALTTLNTTDIAYVDGNADELRTYRFDGSTWSQVGSSFSIAGAFVPAISALSTTDVAFSDSNLEELRTYRFNGSTWSLVGSGLSISGMGNPALAALNATDVAFIDGDLEELRTYRFNGSTWSLVGSGLSITGIALPALAALTEKTVAFCDLTIGNLRTFTFDGSAWSEVGSSLAVSGIGTPAITALSNTDIAFIDNTNDILSVYRNIFIY